MAYKVDYNPSFERDPKSIIGLYRDELLNTEISNIDPLNAEYKQEREKEAPSPGNISNMEDLARSIGDLSDKLESVSDRSDTLEDAITFDPLQLSEDAIKYMDALGIEPNDKFTKDVADCVTYVNNYYTNSISSSPIDDGVNKLDSLNKKIFPEWGIKFILILFYMFLKGITWQILTTLCRAFRSIKLKIGPYRICIGCPFATLFRKLTVALNQGKAHKIDKNGKPVLDANGNIQIWGSCPPDFDPYGYETQNDIANAYRGNDLDGSKPACICVSGDDPSPVEIDASRKLISNVLLETTKNPTDNNLKITQYLSLKANASNFKRTISNLLKNTADANDPKGTVFKFDPVPSANSVINKVSADVQKAITDYSPQKLIDSSTKGLLQLVNGMLKVWDGLTSASAKIAGPAIVNKDMICCFLNLLGILLPTTKIDESIDTKKVSATLSIMKNLIDFELDTMSTQYELEYFTIDELSNAIQDAIMYNVHATLSPVVNKLLEDLKNNIDPNALIAKYQKKIDENVGKVNSVTNRTIEIVKAIQKCALFDVFVKQLSIKIEALQVSIKSWFVGFKGQNDIKTRKLQNQVQMGSRMKLLFSLNLILTGVIESLNKGVKTVISICNEDGNVSPADIQTVQEQLDSSLFNTQPFEIPPPVYNPNTLAGIDDNDPVDTAFQVGEFYDALYSNMPGYGDNVNTYGTILNSEDARNSLLGTTNDNTAYDNAIDKNNRDCTDPVYLTKLYTELSQINNMSTLFDI